MTELTKKYIINGPNNVVRLTDGKKILYVFGDSYYDEKNKRKYELNNNSINIDKMLLEFMKLEKNKEFDLFIENDQKDFIPHTINIFKKKYINQIIKLFNSDIDIKNNKIIIYKKYNNFRFHYFDIRIDLFIYNKLLLYIYNISYNLAYIYKPKYIISSCKNIIYDSYNIIKILNEYYNYIINDKDLDKLFNKYKNNNIKKIINDLFNKYVLINIKFIINNYTKLINFIKKSMYDLKNKFVDDFKKIKILSYIELEVTKNTKSLININVILTDLFFLRRFLDKTYIKNTIVYCGLSHMYNYIYFLTKYFNFEVTNIYYKDKSYILKNIDTTNIFYFKEFDKYLVNYDENLVHKQQVDLFNFPVNFS
jgi:hypothetical protein